jgi:metallo-beta-lactamase family protein
MVTGSRFLLETAGRRYLVDCGLFQVSRATKQLNWKPFLVKPERIEAVLLTHAHIDHAGYLPRLIRGGFRGPVFATEATIALLELLLPDSAHLQEQEAAFANKKGYSRHKPALPLYTVEEAEQTLAQLRPVRFGEPLTLAGLAVTWHSAGHILGSAIISVETDEGGRRIVFSGDLGRYGGEIMASPTQIREADCLLVESTYGDRRHGEQPVRLEMADLVRSVADRGGVLLIPAFAVGRTQEVLYHLRRLEEEGLIPHLPVYIDSPMAVDASQIYCRFGDDHNLDINLLMDEQECPLRCRETHFVRQVEESKRLNTIPGPAIIISASGMCTGGRILHHLKWRLPDPRNLILLVGYQAAGTRGRQLQERTPSVRIHGEEVPVRAGVATLDGLSAHADQSELLRWLAGFERPPERTFLVHGEPGAMQALEAKIGKELGWRVGRPALGEYADLLELSRSPAGQPIEGASSTGA